MSGLVSKGYSLDIIPVETVLDICKFLPALDLLNMSAAYPEIEQLLASTGSPWRIVHLPFPDPLLQCYPGWRKSYPPINVSSSASTSTSISPSYTSDASPERSAEEQGEGNNTTRSGMNILQDERFHVLSEPGYFDLPDIKGGEHDFQDENTAWIILDVLNKIPLQYVQHLSFDSPPCHLRVYPCKRICECERHQNDHSHEGHNHQCQSISESALQTAGDNVQNVQLPPLSQPLRDLFESGLVDFSRHIDLRSLSEVLVMENAGTSSISSSSDGNDGLVFACATGISNLSNPFNGDYSSSSFESQSNQIYETPQDHESIEEFHSHTNTLDQLDLQDVLMELDHIDGVDQLQNNLLNLAQVSELLPTEELDRSEEGEGRDEEQSAEEALEQLRQFSETQAAYQRARHLIRILTLNGLETLETLRAPWWPAARIYTIRQQLERWSFMIEQTQAASAVVPTSDTMECVVDEEPLPILAGSTHQGSLPAGTCIQSTFVPWRTRWTNVIETQSHGDEEQFVLSRELSSNESATSQQVPVSIVFPLPNLSRFILRSGGEVISHERHSIGESAMVLSGRSSAVSSLSSTPTRGTGPTVTLSQSSSVIISASTPTLISSQTSNRPIFRYCHHCGSQYIHYGSNLIGISKLDHRGCFCQSSSPMPS